MQKTEDRFVDVLKFLFAICIVCLHCDVLPDGSYVCWFISKFVFRTAVPFFFLCSGYYFSKSGRTIGFPKALKKYVVRLGIPFLVYSGIYCTYYFAKMIAGHHGFVETVKYILHHLVFYPLGALWFLSASIVAAALFVLLKQLLRCNKFVILIIGVVLYLFALLANTYYFVSQAIGISPVIDMYLKIFLSPRNGLFLGLVYFALGDLLVEKEWKFGITSAIYLTVGTLGLIDEIILTKDCPYGDEQSLFLSHLIFIPALFVAAKSVPFPEHIDTKLLRKLSSGIYFVHRIIRDPLYDFWAVVFKSEIPHILLFAVVIVLSSLIALFLAKTKNKFLRKLI